MDLRNYITEEQLKIGVKLINEGKLFYQPFILHNDLEIGEGQNFCDRYKGVENISDFNVWAKNFDIKNRKFPVNKDYFTKCNAEYRKFYEYIVDSIIRLERKKLKELTFGEIGCNTGLTLFELAKRGAKECMGYDWNDMSSVFDWLNDILGTQVVFRQGTWDNLYHYFDTCNINEVDIMINTIYTNHQFDPLQFLAYICDSSRIGVFLWVLTNGEDGRTIRYPDENLHKLLENNRAFPLNINNDISISKDLLYSSLNKLGFEEIIELNPQEAVNNSQWIYFTQGFQMVYAKRTQNIKSAFWEYRNIIKQPRSLASHDR